MRYSLVRAAKGASRLGLARRKRRECVTESGVIDLIPNSSSSAAEGFVGVKSCSEARSDAGSARKRLTVDVGNRYPKLDDLTETDPTSLP